MFPPSGPPKTEAQLKKEAKKKEKLEKFQQKKDMEAKKKTQPPAEVKILNFYKQKLLKGIIDFNSEFKWFFRNSIQFFNRKKPNLRRRSWE